MADNNNNNEEYDEQYAYNDEDNENNNSDIGNNNPNDNSEDTDCPLCIAKGSLVTLSDGTNAPIEQICQHTTLLGYFNGTLEDNVTQFNKLNNNNNKSIRNNEINEAIHRGI